MKSSGLWWKGVRGSLRVFNFPIGLASGIILIISSVILIAQGTGNPNNIRVKVDANNSLLVATAAQVLPLSNPTVFSNTRVRTDANNALVITDASGGGGFLPANVAAGQVLTSGTTPTYSATPQITAIGLGATAPAAGLKFANGTVFTDSALGVTAMVSSGAVNAIRIPNGSGLEFGFSRWSSNVFEIGLATNSGTGRNLRIIGSGAGGTNIIFNASGSDNWQINTSGHLTAPATNTFDIGAASGVTAPRTIYAATSVITPLVSAQLTTVTAVTSVANVGANSCGTTAATIAGTNNTGIVTVGATSGTQCRILFSRAATTRRQCTVTNETTSNLSRTAYIDTTHNDLLGVFVAGDILAYVCLDY